MCVNFHKFASPKNSVNKYNTNQLQMYSYIAGKLVEKTPTFVVIDVNGIGYFIHISLHTFSKLGNNEDVKLFTHLVVREDAQLLYGFSSEIERHLFKQLITVSGIGANTARLILSALDAAELQEAIIKANITVLQSIKGIGNKTAQRIIVDLKDKLDKEGITPEKLDLTHNTKKEEALSGLIILGFNKGLAEKAIDRILKEKGASLSVEDLIKDALKIL